MIDRDKVVKGLECCKWSRQNVKPEKVKCDECPYKDQSILNAYTVWRSCTNVLAGDALALLKEQEALQIVYRDNPYIGLPVAHCPKCGKSLSRYHAALYEQTKFCLYCGQAVKWQ